ncbi:uncharacterized protein LOC135841015 [Planococcus citri]|uniref:uncharacterized protein LOC135841015 n=1 Tax=Planococcus citri TaxID=170843 RepID=UPI0031F9FDF6
MMRFVEFKLNFITFYLMVFHLSYGDSNGRFIRKGSVSGFPDQESQIPFYRDAENYGQPSEFQIIKHLVPVGYSSHIVSPREAVLPVNEVVIDPNVAQHPITILPYPNHAAIRPPVNDQRYYNADVLLKALESAVKDSTNSTDTNTTTSFQDKVQLIARLMVMVPTFADEIFKCLSRSETLSKFIQMTHNGDT